MSNKETRAYSFEIRAEQADGKGRIFGTPIVYDSWTDLGYFDEKIERGALDHTDLKDVRFLVNHDTSMIPLARSRNNNENSTMQLIPTGEGMDMRTDLDIERNATASELYSALERGDISGMSFMFTIDGERWEDLETEHPKRTITSIGKVFEVSAVTFPAYESTTIGVRDTEALESAKSTLENVRASLENEEKVKSIKEEIKKILGD